MSIGRITALALISLFAPQELMANGVVDFVEGNVSITTTAGEVRIPVKGDRVNVGDLLVTGGNGEIQLHMDDNGLIAMRANTRLVIQAYTASGGEKDNVLINLISGTFRSITGWIGKLHPNNYSVRTPTVSIGVRGTDHEPMVVTDGPNAGTYDKVNSGGTTLHTPFGKVNVGPKQAGFAPKDKTQPPKLLAAIPPIFKPTKNEAMVDKGKEKLEKTMDEKLKQKQDENIRKGADKDGKPKIGSAEDGRKALDALNRVLRDYEMGNIESIRNRLDPSMIGYQALLDDMRQEANRCKQMRVYLQDTQVQAGPDLAVIQTAWEKRCLQVPSLTPLLTSGRGTFLLHRGAGGWGFAAITGSNVFSSQGVLAQLAVPAPITGAARGAGSIPGLVAKVVDPDLSNQRSVQVTVVLACPPAATDTEVVTLPAVTPGVFQATLNGVYDPSSVPNILSGDGVIRVATMYCVGKSLVFSYVDTTPGTGTAPVTVTQSTPIQ